MVREHIFHVSINCDAYMKFACAVSEIYGDGIEDCAMPIDTYIAKVPFKHIIDRRIVASQNVEQFSELYPADIAPDDTILNAVSPYLTQTFQMIMRIKGFDCTMDEIEHCYFTNIGFWQSYLLKNRITLVLFNKYPHGCGALDFIIYQVAHALGIKTIFKGLSIWDARAFYAQTIEEPFTLLKKTLNRLQLEYADVVRWEEIPLSSGYDEIFRKQIGEESKKTPSYMSKKAIADERCAWMCGFSYVEAWVHYKHSRENRKALGLSWRNIFRLWVYAVFGLFQRYIDRPLFNLKISMTLAYLLRKEARETVKLEKTYKKVSVPADFHKKYIYFPLHMQPECTTIPQAGKSYYNHAVPIRILASVLPDDVYIYVKENPKQAYGARKKAFYKELLAIPHVVLVDPKTNTYELIKNSIAVSTLTGTAGWEGLFYQKPFIMFGYWVTRSAPGVFHVRTKEECKIAVDNILLGRISWNLKDLRLFFKAMDESEGYSIDLIDNNDPWLDEKVKRNLELFKEYYESMYLTE